MLPTPTTPAAPITPSTTRVGWVGVGIMGCSMVSHLLGAGYRCTIYNRTPSKCVPLQAKGAAIATSPKAVAEQADVVFVIVGLPTDVREVVLGPDGVLAGLKPGGVMVDCTTSTPSLAQEMYAQGQQQGVATIDAPVSGGDTGAKTAALSFMIGGDKKVVERLRPLFELMGKNVRHMGGAGSGQHTKMVNQILIANTMIGKTSCRERKGEEGRKGEGKGGSGVCVCFVGAWACVGHILFPSSPLLPSLPSSLHLRRLRRPPLRSKGGVGPD
jgi:3-hydroxyisobutyrate dehydrogenase